MVRRRAVKSWYVLRVGEPGSRGLEGEVRMETRARLLSMWYWVVAHG